MYTKDGSIKAVLKSGEGSFEVKRLMIEDL
jgi:hypothetical protein